VSAKSRTNMTGFVLFAGLMLLLLALGRGVIAQDWRTASHAPVGLAPDPAATPEAVVQVYSARTFGWRGSFGVHTWIAAKRANAPAWTVYEVIGWRLRWSDSALAIRHRAPDARWYGNAPELLAERRGEGVDDLIGRIDEAARAYPWANEYAVWPGPNSNTFTAWVLRAVPELEVDLPPTAIGKDYSESLFGRAPSGSGIQFSLGGVFALTASKVEGFEVNVLGLTFGVNPFSPSLKLPVVGRIGVPRANGSALAAPAESQTPR
jgi:hypothetical protein